MSNSLDAEICLGYVEPLIIKNNNSGGHPETSLILSQYCLYE